jgi:hypothetical protein
MEMPWSRDRGIFFGAVIAPDFVGVPIYCRSELAREDGLAADLAFVDRVHIRYLGNGSLWFRPYGESLLSNAVRVNVPVASLLFQRAIALRLASLAPTCDEFDCVERRCAPIPG